MQARAVFLDRDGTLVHARHYPSRPEELVLFDAIAPALQCLQAASVRLIIVTNQAGLALGYFDEAVLTTMHAHLTAELERLGVHLDAIYHCPHHPAGIVPGLARTCDCHKPQPGLLQRAAADLNLDLSRSWLVGDILHDVEAGNRAGCRTVLVDNGGETEWITGPFRAPEHVAPDTATALAYILAAEGLAAPYDSPGASGAGYELGDRQ